MSDEVMLSTEDMSLITAIETCNQHVNDLKKKMVHSFSSLEKQIGNLSSSYNSLVKKIESLENAMKNSSECENHNHQCCQEVLSKINSMENILKSLSVENRFTNLKDSEDVTRDSSQSPVVLVRNAKPAQVSASLCLDSTIQVITLNSESDFPDGSWLGDDSNCELRVRCPISPPNLLHINTFCETPEKMAVTLLDYLFPRDVLAVSNLSGKGKHGKKQLDPLMIYGIRCHLVHKFNINERDWYRIKQNMDSKCRTAWRKKVKGLPLRRSKNSENNSIGEFQEIITDDGQTIILTESAYHLGNAVEEMETQIIHTNEGDIKVLHATPDQIVRIQEGAHIQVLSEDLILPVLRDYPQLLVGGDEDEVSSGHILQIGCNDQSLTVPTSEMNIDSEVGIDSSHFIEVQDSSLSSQVIFYVCMKRTGKVCLYELNEMLDVKTSKH